MYFKPVRKKTPFYYELPVSDCRGGAVGLSIRLECGIIGVQIPAATDLRRKNR